MVDCRSLHCVSPFSVGHFFLTFLTFFLVYLIVFEHMAEVAQASATAGLNFKLIDGFSAETSGKKL